MDQINSLELLRKLTATSRVRRRSKALLLDPVKGSRDCWFMYVPPCFNEALDVKFNCGEPNPGWTQAACFSFKDGDRLYDSREAYARWDLALKNVKLSISVTSSSPAGPSSGGVRYSGNVVFDVLLPSLNRSTLVKAFQYELTQDQFVELLISGPVGHLATLIESHS